MNTMHNYLVTIRSVKQGVLGVVVALCAASFVGYEKDVYVPVRNESFSKGEVLEFKMTYGFFTVGKGSAKIHPNYFQLNNRHCFKVDVYGKTVGLVDWVADVDDHWGAYIDTMALVPHQFYRKIREGSYRKDEWTHFDHANRKIEVKTLDNGTGKFKESKWFTAPPSVRDMIGGFLYLRTMDLSRLRPKDTVAISGFFEDTFYSLKILYAGREVVKTKAGKFRTLKFIPVMPDNKVFDGENSVTAWFTDDKNRIPVKIDAEMFIGTAGVELTHYSGLRNPVSRVK